MTSASLRYAAHSSWQRQTHLAGSGMDALSTALMAASRSHGKTGFHMPEQDRDTDYFEVAPMLDYKADIKDSGAIVMYTLNPSMPTNLPDLTGLINTIKTKLNDKEEFPTVTLVIDNTIEIDSGSGSQLDVIFRSLAGEISAGRLQIMLAKSYQKYASHGTGKIMAGDVTTINNGSREFEKTRKLIADMVKKSDSYDLEESQLMMHMLAHGHQGELDMIQHAARNAELINDLWPEKAPDGSVGWLPGLPFVSRSRETFGTSWNNDTSVTTLKAVRGAGGRVP